MEKVILELQAKLRRQLEEMHSLLGDVISKTQESDYQAKLRHADWSDRHRLHVMIEAAEETLKKLPDEIVDPQFLVELARTVEVFKNASTKPGWEEIKPSLASKLHFPHTLAKLNIAEHFERQGHEVELVPRGDEASPDLRVRAMSGKDDWLFIECYQPDILNGRRTNISRTELEQIIRKSMEKAKVQIGQKRLGVLAICCYFQPKSNLNILRQSIESRLAKTSRTYLAGMIIASFTTVVNQGKELTEFIPTYRIDLILNPSYFGNIEVRAESKKSDPLLIKEPMAGDDVADLISGKIAQSSNEPNNMTANNLKTEIRTRRITLKIIEKPAPNSRIVFYFSMETEIQISTVVNVIVLWLKVFGNTQLAMSFYFARYVRATTSSYLWRSLNTVLLELRLSSRTTR